VAGVSAQVSRVVQLLDRPAPCERTNRSRLRSAGYYPLVQAGAIVPLGKRQQCTGQKTADTQEVRVYPGTDGRFDLYEDESYRYEQGQHTLIDFAWDEKRQVLTIGPRQGAYPGALAQRVFNLVWPGEATGLSAAFGIPQKQVVYTGKTLTIKR
jgi:alpha-D-xyloside xylohydrolase